MKIEILYPEIANIFGDYSNIKYLEKSLPHSKIIYTSLADEPYFVKHKVDLIYLGSMSEEFQDLVIEKLSKYTTKLKKCIEDNTIVLFTGMAFELIGEYIEEKGKKTKTLNLFEVYFKKDKTKHNNSLFIGKFNNYKIAGNKSSFTFMYGNNKYPFIKTLYGSVGMNEDSNLEGIHYKNFFGTSLLGPLLILNPYFTEYLIKLKYPDYKLLYKKELIESYNKRVSNLENRKNYIL